MSKITEKAAELDQALKSELGEIELGVIGNYTLADAIREGCKVTVKEEGWGNGGTPCAMRAAGIAATNRGFVKIPE